MANYKLKTQFNYGKHKGQKVSQVLENENGRRYLCWLHNSDKNVKLTEDVQSLIRVKDKQLHKERELNLDIVTNF